VALLLTPFDFAPDPENSPVKRAAPAGSLVVAMATPSLAARRVPDPCGRAWSTGARPSRSSESRWPVSVGARRSRCPNRRHLQRSTSWAGLRRGDPVEIMGRVGFGLVDLCRPRRQHRDRRRVDRGGGGKFGEHKIRSFRPDQVFPIPVVALEAALRRHWPTRRNCPSADPARRWWRRAPARITLPSDTS